MDNIRECQRMSNHIVPVHGEYQRMSTIAALVHCECQIMSKNVVLVPAKYLRMSKNVVLVHGECQ